MIPTRRPQTTARRLGLVPLIVSLALAGCIPAPEQTPAPVPAPAPALSPARPPVAEAPPPPAGHWMDAPVTPGDWRWRRSGSESIAEFFPPQGQLLFQVACTAQGVFLSRTMAGGATITVRTETAERTMAANLSGIGLRTLLDPRDPLLDAIAFSRGRFAVEAAGAPNLYLPSWPEITRVIEDCR